VRAICQDFNASMLAKHAVKSGFGLQTSNDLALASANSACANSPSLGRNASLVGILFRMPGFMENKIATCSNPEKKIATFSKIAMENTIATFSNPNSREWEAHNQVRCSKAYDPQILTPAFLLQGGTEGYR
jgi:hypothetical protein